MRVIAMRFAIARSGRGMVDLERRVPYVVLVGQEQLQIGADGVAIRPRVDQHVRGRGGHPRGYLPDVQVVDLGYARSRHHGRADCFRIKARRGGLEEDPAGIADQTVPGAQHQGDDQQRRDRVRAGKAGHEDDQASGRRRRERVHVGQDVRESALDIQAVSARCAGDEQGGCQVDRDACQRDAEHRAAGDMPGHD